MTRYWMGVVQRAHVERGVALGIAQSNHGALTAIVRMSPGDGLVYYSPKTDYPDGAPLKQFTAIGTVDDAEPWQAEEGSFQPWRRRISYADDVRPTPIAPLLDELELTRGNRNWGYVLRRGMVELSAADFTTIARAMGADSLVP